MAITFHQAGQLQEAGECYLAILQNQPSHPEANYNLGMLAVQANLPAAGLPYFTAALDADPARGQYWISYIDALLQADQREDARKILALARQQGLEGEEVEALARLLNNEMPTSGQSSAEDNKNPTHQEINALVALFSEGRLTEAATLAKEMTERFPLHEFGWKALGAVFKQMGQSADALTPMQKAAALSPGDVEAHYNLGVILQDLDRLDEAEASYRQALQINPDYAEAHNNLDVILQAPDRPGEAEISYRKALQANPYNLVDHEMPYQLVKARHGWFLVSPLDIYLGRAVVTYGECCEIEWKLLEQILMRLGKDAIEVGANVGVHTVSMASTLAGMGRRLLAVEPQPVVFQNMCANLALNGLFNVIAENAACGNAPGWLSFSAPDYHRQNNSGGVSMREDGSGNQSVRAVRLDELVPEDFDVGLIKIDVEGFEQRVLEGATQTIARFRPVIYLENDRVEHSKALIEWLWAANYKLWWHIPRLFNPDNFVGKKENIYGNVASFNMLALPNEMTLSVKGLVSVEDSNMHPLKSERPS